MIDVVRWSAAVLFMSQILVDGSLGYPALWLVDDLNNVIPEGTRSKRSPREQLICQPKKHMTQSSGVITSPHYKTPPDGDASCSWSIHARSERKVHLQFQIFNVVDTCAGICKCNYVTIKEPSRNAKPVSWKYCNERKPPRVFVSTGKRLKIHLSLKAGSSYQNNRFTISYTTKFSKGESSGRHLAKVHAKNYSGDIRNSHEQKFIKTPVMRKTIYSNARIDENEQSRGVRKIIPTSGHVAPTVRNRDPTDDHKESGPSKLTVLLAVAIPVVMIFILVVLLIAYYNYVIEIKQIQRREDIPNSRSALSDMILNSGVTLAPMFNLNKAKRESSNRREKANQLYDDMLQSWRATHANRKERLRAKQESVDVWESYQASRKQRRNTRVPDKSDSKAFAMLLSSAINVSSTHSLQDVDVEEDEVKPRPSSILINRIFSDDIHHKRSSKVLSWSDISTKSKEEPVSEKRATSATELKLRGSGHIPAIVVSQPSFETEDDDGEAKDTDRLIKYDKKDGAEEMDSEKIQPESSKPTYSCSEHVKDILRESYGEELEEWWQKPKNSESQQSDDVETKMVKKDRPTSLKLLPDSDMKDDAMKAADDDDID